MLSPDAIASMWVRREVAFAMNDPRYEDRIVPLNYLETDLEQLEWLKLFQMIDFRADFADGCRGLLQTWGVGLRPDRLA